MQFALAVLLAATGVVTNPGKTGVVTTGESSAQIIARDMQVVHFPKGTADLPSVDATALRKFAATTAKEAPLDKLIVAAWSDATDQQAQGKKELASDRKLAHARGDAVKKILVAAGIPNVTVYDMAESPSWWAEELREPSALIKNYSSQGIGPENAREALLSDVGRQIQDKGGAGSAVVVAKWKGEVATH